MAVTAWEKLEDHVLSDDWALLRKARLRLTFDDGSTQDTWRQTYDRGDGAVILPYDNLRGHVLLGRQFRWPAAARGDADPHLIEAAAGLLEAADPGERIRQEASEELGLSVGAPEKVFEIYMSPGSVTEILHFFIAPYTGADVTRKTGGLRSEGEDIDILDLPLAQALAMMADGRIRDAKTIILLQHMALHVMPEHAKGETA